MDRLFDPRAVVGMVHLPPLPGSPRFDGDRERPERRALADAERLEAGGVDGLLVENFGDAPFFPDSVPPHVVASMTALVGAVVDAVSVPVGVNVLRNDAAAALSVAAATGASFVRVNVHTGARATDQGVLEGRAHETLRLRNRLDADVRILADVGVKHSTSLGDAEPLDRAVDDAVSRGLADGVVASGEATGGETARSDIEAVAAAAHDRNVPAFVGSGVTAETVGDVLDVADGVVVGSAFEVGGEAGNRVDEERVRDLVAAAR